MIVEENQHLEWEDYYRLINEGRGMDNVLLADVEQSEDSENNWDRIVNACNA